MEAHRGWQMGTRKPTDEAARSAPDGPNEQTDERAARRRRRADDARLQKLVRKLATRPSPGGDR
jgi:hypothetical protein